MLPSSIVLPVEMTALTDVPEDVAEVVDLVVVMVVKGCRVTIIVGRVMVASILAVVVKDNVQAHAVDRVRLHPIKYNIKMRRYAINISSHNIHKDIIV